MILGSDLSLVAVSEWGGAGLHYMKCSGRAEFSLRNILQVIHVHYHQADPKVDIAGRT